MRIVDRTTFLSMPANTLFAKFEPSVFEALMIKGDTIGGDVDFYYQDIVDAIDATDSGELGELLDRAAGDGASISMNFNVWSRDGCFDPDQLFAIFEAADVAALIERLVRCR